MIRVRSASVNYKDLFVAKGIPPRDPSAPLIPLSDAAGEVVNVGSKVTRVKPGDKVAGIVAQSWIRGDMNSQTLQSILGTSMDGVLAECVVLNQEESCHFAAHLAAGHQPGIPIRAGARRAPVSGNGRSLRQGGDSNMNSA